MSYLLPNNDCLTYQQTETVKIVSDDKLSARNDKNVIVFHYSFTYILLRIYQSSQTVECDKTIWSG